ncbi:prenylcysteine oxidase [Sodiomyces alkalinus F11]|uniref:Prenylcysteine oxidase n=1 Tax=Sodiomyces alkalinus (strain CBS 110278 / VKM F-3762 / F11) TaxID=1314773 RepID=A0A3N2PU15_SODAK|nr:prenylcysteine oxidase [Sodiomyces alkalinus F11]ROT37954.1 prenylcysteine oxidase [Sodiomyces alkalinus F11]
MWSQLSSLLSAFSLTTASAGTIADDGVRQVAVIGAGAGGSATAYYLQQFAEQAGLAVNISVFEKTGRVGGRTLTVNAYDEPLEAVELGASIFVEINQILFNATQEFNLALREPDSAAEDLLGIWNGDNFVFTQDSQSSGWWNLAKLFWRYGMAPYKTQKLVQSTLQTFMNLYEEPYFPFVSLTQTLGELDLLKITGVTGAQFLAENEISEAFARDIIQAATRVNYASNLAYIHGLETMVSLAPEGAVQVVGGNWQIFDKMLQHSNATVHRNTQVGSIAFKNNTGPGADAKYVLSTRPTGSDAETVEEHYPIAFDKVVVATPWQFADITAKGDVLQQAIDEIPYTKLHVTLFCSPFRLSPGYFNLPPGSKTPDSVLTTLGPDEVPKEGAAGGGKAGFYSISTLRAITNPKTQTEEYLYKVFSPEKLTPEFLSAILGVKVPDTFVSEDGSAAVDEEGAAINPVSWYYPHVFHSYPIQYPRVTFQDLVVGSGLYYTSGMESFISTMETSALMGRNIARLVTDELATLLDGETQQSEPEVQEDLAPVQDGLGLGNDTIPDEL